MLIYVVYHLTRWLLYRVNSEALRRLHHTVQGLYFRAAVNAAANKTHVVSVRR